MEKLEIAISSLKSNRKQLRVQLLNLEEELVFCYLPAKSKDRLINSLVEAIEILNEEINQIEDQLMFKDINQGLGL